ncbi:Proprotein convertase P-domain-containing protein [Noviherbaspirillum humi]|uniref:Proprotein convertase P-domain-containing protein n=1 Tax=Noviherbaspirillum humi TaxID=1688639 RepID=A0A239G7Q2_9BURK|nr:S8 family serine peptidase [Noviherbaspirillum humi]SNS64483.1 Proprotein convertase P-domain-containing protein [Noviherbaspirillum humi]
MTIRRVPRAAWIPWILLLASCGGGGGGSGDTSTSSRAVSSSVAGTAGPVVRAPGDAGPDPLFPLQWYLKNTGQRGANNYVATAGEDINVEPVWAACADAATCRGEGIAIAVVDSGLEIAHKDLQANMSTTLNHRVYARGAAPVNGDPTPPRGSGSEPSLAHGTMVAGIIAARDANGIGGLGVAPRASLVAYRLAGVGASAADAAEAMAYQAPAIAVSNNSYGPLDDTGQAVGAPTLWQTAVNEGLATGRGGRGTIYVWANGNGGETVDLSTYDGKASYRGVIAVGAVDAQGKRVSYSERGANMWVSAPAGRFCSRDLTIVTTDLSGDRGENAGGAANDLADGDFTQCMNGTSAAAPVVSGVVALMLQANPALSWRDVRAILANTARQNDPANAGWKKNAAGHAINDAYGFGVVNAAAAVTAARGWTSLPPQLPPVSVTQPVNRPIPDNNTAGIVSDIPVAGSGIRSIEWVDVSVSAGDHPYSADLEIVLTAPSGTQSILAETHVCFTEYPTQARSCAPYDNWRFGIARHLDEPADGVWRLEVRDKATGDVGTFQSWQLTIYGH